MALVATTTLGSPGRWGLDKENSGSIKSARHRNLTFDTAPGLLSRVGENKFSVLGSEF